MIQFLSYFFFFEDSCFELLSSTPFLPTGLTIQAFISLGWNTLVSDRLQKKGYEPLLTDFHKDSTFDNCILFEQIDDNHCMNDVVFPFFGAQ